MKCTNCDAEGLKEVAISKTLHGITHDIAATRCDKCDEVLFTFTALKNFEDFVVSQLEAGLGELNPKSKHFMSMIRRHRKKTNAL